MKSQIYGLRDVGEYKVYRKGKLFFASHKNNERLRRLQLLGERTAVHLAFLTKSDFVQGVEQMLNDAKRSGSPRYFEVVYGR